MESQSQNPEFRNNPKNVHPCRDQSMIHKSCYMTAVMKNNVPDTCDNWNMS